MMITTEQINKDWGEDGWLVRIYFEDKCATSIEEIDEDGTKQIRDHAYISPLELALWFANNWWRLCLEPKLDEEIIQNNNDIGLDWALSHEMNSIGGGWIWPNIRFFNNGESISVVMKESSQDHTHIKYINDFETTVDIATFENAVSGFIESVIAAKNCDNEDDPEFEVLEELWDIVQTERKSPELYEERKKEAVAGFDPEEMPEEV